MMGTQIPTDDHPPIWAIYKRYDHGTYTNCDCITIFWAYGVRWTRSIFAPDDQNRSFESTSLADSLFPNVWQRHTTSEKYKNIWFHSLIAIARLCFAMSRWKPVFGKQTVRTWHVPLHKITHSQNRSHIRCSCWRFKACSIKKTQLPVPPCNAVVWFCMVLSPPHIFVVKFKTTLTYWRLQQSKVTWKAILVSREWAGACMWTLDGRILKKNWTTDVGKRMNYFQFGNSNKQSEIIKPRLDQRKPQIRQKRIGS